MSGSTAAGDALSNRANKRIVDVCDAVGEFIEYWGFKGALGRAWTLLALHREPLQQAEIAQHLDMSRSLVSGLIAELTEYGLVRPVGPGRNAPFQAIVDVWPTITDVLRSREWLLMDTARRSLEAALDEVDAVEAAGLPPVWDRRRLRWLLSLTGASQRLLKLLLSLRSLSPPRGLGRWLSQAVSAVRALPFSDAP